MPTHTPSKTRTPRSAKKADIFDDIEGANTPQKNPGRKPASHHPTTIQSPQTKTPDTRRSARDKKSTQKSTRVASGTPNHILLAHSKLREGKGERDESTPQSGDNSETPSRSQRERKPSAKAALIAQEKDGHGSSKAVLNGVEMEARDAADTSPAVSRKRGRPSKATAAGTEATPELTNGLTPSGRKKRLREEDDEPSSTKRRRREASPIHTPSKTPLRRQVLAEDDVMSEDEPAAETPSKKKRGRPPGSSKKETEAPTVEVSPFDRPPKREIIQLVTVAKKAARKGEDQAVACLSGIVLEKLSGKRRIPLIQLEDEYAKVKSLIEATVAAGEGNSMAVIGARGSGKSVLVETVLSDLSKTQKQYFHVVRLNGFIQTDDKLALREIWRQLGREMEIDEEAGKSYADTLTMLLALLSHPDEIAGENVGQIAKSVIFIMDEFDLFASHARQTLLYNLLDIAQSRKAPIAVIGLTTKFDVKESLEKRVKSRFSHRYVHVSLAKSMNTFKEIGIAALSVQKAELTFEEKSLLLQETPKGDKRGKSSGPFEPLLEWNTAAQTLFQDPFFVSRYVRSAYHLTKSISSVFSSLLLPIAMLASQTDLAIPYLLSSTNILEHYPGPSLQAPSSTLPLILPGLSDVQLALLISAARLDIIHDSDTVSFAMAYAQYVELASNARVQSAAAGALALGAGARVWGREVAKGEWETLIRHGLLIPLSEGAGLVGTSGLVKIDVRLEEIPGACPDISGTMERWCRQI